MFSIVGLIIIELIDEQIKATINITKFIMQFFLTKNGSTSLETKETGRISPNSFPNPSPPRPTRETAFQSLSLTVFYN